MTKNTDKITSKDHILEAALQVFVKKGYSATRMEDIVSSSGYSKGAIYHHYSSKKELFLSLIDYWEAYSFPYIFDNDLEKLTSSDCLRLIIKNILKTFKTKKYVFLAELEFWALANHDDDVRTKTKELYNRLLMLFKKIINKGISEGEFKSLDVDVAALSIMTSIQGVIWFSIFEESSLSAEQYLNNVLEFILYGFKK